MVVCIFYTILPFLLFFYRRKRLLTVKKEVFLLFGDFYCFLVIL